jgi:hypothetical protein
MAVGENTYGTVVEIEKLIGDIVLDRKFKEDTVPTKAQVETELDNIAADLNNALDAAGYTVPVDEANYPVAYAFLKAANSYGAAASLLSTIPANAYNSNEDVEEVGETRASTYSNKLKSAIKKIENHKLRAGMREGRLSKVYAGSAEDDNGNVKKPIFTRGMDDYPGRQSLVESEEDEE